MTLRPYQHDMKRGVYAAWDAGLHNVLMTLATGGGKTRTFTDIVAEFDGPSIVIAHRQELVAQISLALNQYGVRHRIIAPPNVVAMCTRLHMEAHGASYYRSNARAAAAGVDTLAKRSSEMWRWLRTVRLWVQDEAHHVLQDNKWGAAAAAVPNALGLGVTATAGRADGKGLGRHADGLFDTLVEGPQTRDLIEWGYLSDYRVIAPPARGLEFASEDVSRTTGDYKPKALKQRTRASSVMGDIVAHYLRHTPGKRGVTFTTDVDSAGELAESFNQQGVPAEVLTAKTPAADRAHTMQRLARGDVLQVVNVDILGEGTDVPALDVVSMGRRTESLGLMIQQAGRVLRPIYAEGMPLDTVEQRKAAIAAGPKPRATIIDHVGNIYSHYPPDTRRHWTLDRRERGAKRAAPDDAVPVRTCLNETCLSVYERTLPRCPYCGHVPEPQGRSRPEQVDGDLIELDPAALAQLRGEIERIDGPPRIPQHAGPAAQQGAKAQHRRRQEAQDKLREAIAWWAGYQRAQGRSDSESYRRFYHTFGTDVLTAQTLGRAEAEQLATRIASTLAAEYGY